jgi:hypothetical protein
MKPAARHRGALLALALAAVAVAGGAAALWSRSESERAEGAERERRARAAQAWADMQQCLVGARLGDVPALDERVRRIELAGEKSDAEDGWPRRCGKHVSDLYQALDDHSFGAALREELRQRFACANACSPSAPAAQLAGLLDAASAAGLALVEPTVAAPAMVTTALLSKADLGQISEGDTLVRDRDHLPDGSARYLFDSRAKGLSLCEVRPDAERGLDCRAARAPISAASVALVPGASRPLLRGREPTAAPTAFDLAGDPVRLHGARESGFSVRRGDGAVLVAHVREGAATAERKIELGPSAADPFVVGDALFWFEEEEGQRRLFVRRFSLDGGKIAGERQLVGAAGKARGIPTTCKNGDTTVLLFGGDRASFAMVIGQGERWSAPVAPGEAPAPPPVPAPQPPVKPDRKPGRFAMVELIEEMNEREEPSPWSRPSASASARPEMWSDEPLGEPARRAKLSKYAVQCGGGAGLVTWRTPHGDEQHIARLRCTAEGCREEKAALAGIDVKEWWLAASFGEATLLVWRDGAGMLRSRHAPIAGLAAASDTLVMDSAEHGGPTTLDLEAVIGANALVFVFKDKAFHALRFGADGSYTALAL